MMVHVMLLSYVSGVLTPKRHRLSKPSYPFFNLIFSYLLGLESAVPSWLYTLLSTFEKCAPMCNECVFERKVCDSCGELATFCCRKCRIRLCYKCNVTLTLNGLKDIDACLQCGEKLR
jgi:hypothetical protein